MRDRTRTTRYVSIGLDSLEGRVVLSASPIAMFAPLKGDLTHGISYLDLQGKVQGSSSTTGNNPDIGKRVTFHGSGNISGLGKVQVAGKLSVPGFVAESEIQGTLTLSNSRGSLVLRLQSSPNGGFEAPRSRIYSFQSIQGTGAFHNHFGNGTIDLRLAQHAFTIDFHGKPNIY